MAKENFRKELGASSTKLDVFFAEVPIEGSVAVGQRFGLGKLKYGLNNWKNGNEWFLLERMTHIENHWLLFKRDGDEIDDNIGAVLWGCYVLKWYRAHRPEIYQRALAMVQGDKVYEFPQETGKLPRKVRRDRTERRSRISNRPTNVRKRKSGGGGEYGGERLDSGR